MKLLSFVLLALAASACVDHRPIRNGLMNESVYLTKESFTNANPKFGSNSTDDTWLFKVTTVATSSPNVLGDYVFPGMESDTQLVRFRFAEDAMQMLDARQLQPDNPNDPNDDRSSSVERVMMEFAGGHVDVKLRESLDGERTNYLEENTELPWQERQKFKVDFEKSNMDPVAQIAWYYGDFLHECGAPISTNLVADSFEWDDADQYMAFTLEVNYKILVNGGCWDMTSFVYDAGTTTINYKFSFYRPGPNNYVPQVIAEKDPVNKRYGSFQVLNTFEDPMSGLLSAKSLIQRWNPNRTDPVIYYFSKGFPPMYKPDMVSFIAETNQTLADAGATLRVELRDFNDGGIERTIGDLRYSFIVWHQDIETTRGLLGYGPTSSDPRTGEAISANVNLYNVGMDYYRFLVQAFLEDNGGIGKPDPEVPWEETPCDEGDTVAPPDNQSTRLQTALFDEMRNVMNISPSASPTDDFVPTPVHPDFANNYHRVLSELRYAEPGYNSYTWRPSGRFSVEEFKDRMRMERDFQIAMEDLLANNNPFGPASAASVQGIEERAAWREQMNAWLKNHQQLEDDRAMVVSRKCLAEFSDVDAISIISKGARQCTSASVFESDTEYTERIIKQVVARTGIHEFGHTMSLRHNFYGSADAKHMNPGEPTSSVMDYVWPIEELGAPIQWGQYDLAAMTWIYGTEAKRAEVMTEDDAHDFLYCTDEHSGRSPMCRTFDLGVTPSQVVLNAIERYDWLYEIRNRRAFRTFWDTSGYVGSVYNGIFPLNRMWYMALFDWGGGGVQDTLKRLDQLSDTDAHPVLTQQQYNEVAADFYNDIQAANGMIIGFYDAVINEAASFRNFQTEYDPYYGDVMRLGIIVDKLFATLAYMDFQETYDYNPNVYTYVAMFDMPFGDRNSALAEKVLDNFLGAGYDTFPWFQYTALEYFAYATNSNLINNTQLRDRIAIRRYNTLEAFEEEFPGALEQALQTGNTAQLFSHEGKQYVYTYVADRGWHLVADEGRSPVSFQYMKDYNEALNAQADDTVDNYGLKILLAYYEYYNNFVGF